MKKVIFACVVTSVSIALSVDIVFYLVGILSANINSIVLNKLGLVIVAITIGCFSGCLYKYLKGGVLRAIAGTLLSHVVIGASFVMWFLDTYDIDERRLLQSSTLVPRIMTTVALAVFVGICPTLYAYLRKRRVNTGQQA